VTLTAATRPAAEPEHGALVLFHGRGADEHDLLPLLDALDLGHELAGVSRPDVGLEDQSDPGGVGGDHVDGAFHHGHDLVPLTFDVGEHRVGLARQPRLAYDADRLGHRLADTAGLVAPAGADAECHDHVHSLTPHGPSSKP